MLAVASYTGAGGWIYSALYVRLIAVWVCSLVVQFNQPAHVVCCVIYQPAGVMLRHVYIPRAQSIQNADSAIATGPRLAHRATFQIMR